MLMQRETEHDSPVSKIAHFAAQIGFEYVEFEAIVAYYSFVLMRKRFTMIH